jgi:hypothetical protein
MPISAARDFDLHCGGHRIGGTVATRHGEPEKIMNRTAVVRLGLRAAGQSGKPAVDVASGYLGDKAITVLLGEHSKTVSQISKVDVAPILGFADVEKFINRRGNGD